MATNLEFINQTEITSNVTTINVDNVFSDKYDVYYCQVVGVFHDTDVSNGIEGLRFIDNSGSVITGNEYGYATKNLSVNGYSESKSANNNYMWIGIITDRLSDSGGASVGFYVFNPYNSSSHTFVLSQASGKNSSEYRASKGIGVHTQAEIIRGFQLYESNGARTFGGGQINVYGVK